MKKHSKPKRPSEGRQRRYSSEGPTGPRQRRYSSTLPKPVRVLVPSSPFTPTPPTRSLTPETDFQKTLRFTLRWEGGYVNDPDDPGGATNQGITQKTYHAYCKKKGLPLQSVQLISDAEVQDIYKAGYWDTVQGDRRGWPLNLVLFDTAVNMGPARANEFLEQANKTLDEIPSNDVQELSRRVIDLRVNRYYGLVLRNPRLKKFLNGWLNRVRDLKQASGYYQPPV